LVLIGQATRQKRLLAGLLEHRHEDRDQQSDQTNHDQQLNQAEPGRWLSQGDPAPTASLDQTHNNRPSEMPSKADARSAL
jgi:hypothetical protein